MLNLSYIQVFFSRILLEFIPKLGGVIHLMHVIQNNSCPVGWGCRIHQLHLCCGVRPPSSNECPGYDIKSDGEVPVVLELWGSRSIPSLQLLPGPLWPGVVAPDRVLSMGQIELNWRCAWCNGYRRKTMNMVTRVQILDETDCISHSTNTLGKGMNPIILPPAMGK